MEAAIYTPDGTRYTATQFLELGAAGIAERRHRLICPNSDCRAPASFVNRSRDGRGEHFRSKEHVPGCEYLSEKGEQAGGDEGHPEDIVTNAGRRLILDLDGGAEEKSTGYQTPRTDQADRPPGTSSIATQTESVNRTAIGDSGQCSANSSTPSISDHPTKLSYSRDTQSSPFASSSYRSTERHQTDTRASSGDSGAPSASPSSTSRDFSGSAAAAAMTDSVSSCPTASTRSFNIAM